MLEIRRFVVSFDTERVFHGFDIHYDLNGDEVHNRMLSGLVQKLTLELDEGQNIL